MAYQAVYLQMKLFTYVVARDYGFAPNPFYGYCTLATCKPQIRSTASIGHWVIGTGVKTKYDLAGHLIYAMKVDEVTLFRKEDSNPLTFSIVILPFFISLCQRFY